MPPSLKLKRQILEILCLYSQDYDYNMLYEFIKSFHALTFHLEGQKHVLGYLCDVKIEQVHLTFQHRRYYHLQPPLRLTLEMEN